MCQDEAGSPSGHGCTRPKRDTALVNDLSRSMDCNVQFQESLSLLGFKRHGIMLGH